MRLPAARTRRPTGARAVDLVMPVLNTSARGAATRGRPMTVRDNLAPMIRRAFRLSVVLVPLALAACATQATPPPTTAPPPAPVEPAAPPAPETGSAACRGRVCQYG